MHSEGYSTCHVFVYVISFLPPRVSRTQNIDMVEFIATRGEKIIVIFA